LVVAQELKTLFRAAATASWGCVVLERARLVVLLVVGKGRLLPAAAVVVLVAVGVEKVAGVGVRDLDGCK